MEHKDALCRKLQMKADVYENGRIYSFDGVWVRLGGALIFRTKGGDRVIDEALLRDGHGRLITYHGATP